MAIKGLMSRILRIYPLTAFINCLFYLLKILISFCLIFLLPSCLSLGLFCLLLCDEVPQSDRHIHPLWKLSRKRYHATVLPLGTRFGNISAQIQEEPFLSIFTPYLCPDWLWPVHLPEQIREQYPGVKLKYLAEYCFSGTYIITLLTKGYNFTSENYPNIKFIKKVSRSHSTPFLCLTARRHDATWGHIQSMILRI